MKKKLLITFGMIACWIVSHAQAPDLIYYKFEDSTDIINYATDPVGIQPVAIEGTPYIDTGGFLGTRVLADTGGPRTIAGVDNGWTGRINKSFTLSFWYYHSDSVAAGTSSQSYLFGDSLAGYDCVSTVANGYTYVQILIPDLSMSMLWSGNAYIPHIFTLVYNDRPSKAAPYGTYTLYVDGAFYNSGIMTGPVDMTTSGLAIGHSSGALYNNLNNLNGKIDEFRWYDRALTATEVANTWDIDVSHLGDCPSYTSFTMDSITGDGARIHWKRGAGNTSYFLEYDTAGYTPGTGTMFTGNYPADTPMVILTGLNPETTYDIYFVEICAGGDSVYTPAPYSFETTVPCLMPANLEFSNITTTSANAQWGFTGSLQELYLIYGPVGFDPATSGEVDTVFSTSHTLSNLDQGMWYDVYLVANCGPGNGLGDTIKGWFKTECNPIAAPFFEDFEDASWVPRDRTPTPDYLTDTMNGCWKRTPSWIEEGLENGGRIGFDWHVRRNSPGSYGGFIYPKWGAGFNGNYLCTDGQRRDLGNEAIVYSPFIDVSALTKPYLSFYYHRYSVYQPDVYVEVNDGRGWTTVITMKGSHQLQSGEPYDSTGVDISSFGDTVQVRFRAAYVHDGGYMGLDNFEIKEAPPATCLEVTEIVHTGIGQDTSVTLDLLPGGYDFNFEWGPSGFIQGTGCVGHGADPFTLDSCIGLNTIQDVYIQNNCQDSGLGFSPWTGPFEFCTPFTAPYSNDFDNEDLDDQPQCWKVYSGASVATSLQGTKVVLHAATKAFSDRHVLAIYDEVPYPEDTFMALSPRFIDMPEGDKQVRFVAYAPNSQPDAFVRKMVVGTMSSYTEGSDFHPVDTLSLSQTSWTEYIIPLDPLTTAYNGTDQIIALRYLSPSNIHPNIGTSFCMIDDFHYENSSSCLPPDMTTFKPEPFITDSEARLSWVSRSSGDVTLEWGLPGFVPGTGEAEGTATTADTTYHITGLTAKTDYEVYIRTDCGGGQTYWAGPVKFRTACSILSAPFFEDFDGPQWYAALGGAWNSNNCGDSIDNCWSRIRTCEEYMFGWGLGGVVHSAWGVQDGYTRAAAQDHGGGGNYIFNPEPSGRDTARMYSPVIDVSSLAHPYLSFYYLRPGISGSFLVSVNNGDGQGWRRVMLLTRQQQTSNTSPYRKAGVDLSPYGDTVQICFSVYATGHSGEMAFDDVRIDEAPPCGIPESLSAENVVDTNTGDWSTVLKWEDFQQLATEYEIRFGLEGFADSGAYDNGYADTITTKSYTIDTLKSNTCYEFVVRSICGGDTGAFEGPFVFCTPCEPEVAPYLYPFYSGETVFEPGMGCWRSTSKPRGSRYKWELGYNRIGGAGFTGPDEGMYGSEFVFSESSFGADGDTALMYSPIVDIRQLTTPELSFYYHMYGVDIDTLYLDLYDGLQWYKSILKIGGPQQNYSYDPWKRIAMSLDSFNTTGFVQARFRIKKVGYQGNAAIDEFRIADSLTCPYPFHFRFEDSSFTEATLQWSGDVADDYHIEYGPTGYTYGKGTDTIISNDSSAVIPLSDNLVYDGYIKSICGPGDTSDVVGPIQFHSKVFPCDDVEAYELGPLEDQSSLYRRWDPRLPDNGFYMNYGNVDISDTYAASGTQSLHLFQDTGVGAGIITDIGDTIESGMYNVSYEIFIADNGGAVSEMIMPRSSMSAIFFFDGSTNLCEVYVTPYDGYLEPFPFLNSWNKIEHIIDLDNDTTWMIVNGINIQLGWKYVYYINEYNYPSFSGLHFLTTPSNFNISGDASDFYIDDFCMEEYECPVPSALAVDQNTCTKAIIEWMDGTDSSTTILEYDTTGFSKGSGTSFTIQANSDTLTGLTPGESYDVYVGEICGYDTVFTGPLTITLPTEATADFTIDEGDPTATYLTVDFDGSVSVGGENYSWDFGDGNTGTGVNPSHTYTANGNYSVRLIIESDCGVDTIIKTVVISGISIEENMIEQSLQVYPSPFENALHVSFETGTSGGVDISLMDLSGKIVYRKSVSDINGKFDEEIDLNNLAKGSYMLRVESGDLIAVKRIMKN